MEDAGFCFVRVYLHVVVYGETVAVVEVGKWEREVLAGDVSGSRGIVGLETRVDWVSNGFSGL